MLGCAELCSEEPGRDLLYDVPHARHIAATLILLATDVLLDLALAREPFAADGADVLRWAASGGAAAAAWHSLTNCA